MNGRKKVDGAIANRNRERILQALLPEWEAVFGSMAPAWSYLLRERPGDVFAMTMEEGIDIDDLH